MQYIPRHLTLQLHSVVTLFSVGGRSSPARGGNRGRGSPRRQQAQRQGGRRSPPQRRYMFLVRDVENGKYMNFMSFLYGS